MPISNVVSTQDISGRNNAVPNAARSQVQQQRRQKVALGTALKAHLAIARLDHVTKNVFVLPGIVVPLSIDPSWATAQLAINLVVGLVATTLVACSNYVVNEVLDAPFDRFHPTKHMRPVASGLVNIPVAYAQWILMMIAGIGIGLTISMQFAVVLGILWIMGCIYNIPPLRTKDQPYLDVLTESVNNPLRMLLGWYMVTDSLVAPASLLIAYWMVGCYFMAIKRLSEYRDIDDPARAAAYRRSFAYYSETSLMVSIMFYAATAMLFFGAFIVRYRIELVLSFPFVALVMAVYLNLSYFRESAVQNPEKLHRSRKLMGAVAVCAVVMTALLWVDIPVIADVFRPTLPLVGMAPTLAPGPVSQ